MFPMLTISALRFVGVVRILPGIYVMKVIDAIVDKSVVTKLTIND